MLPILLAFLIVGCTTSQTASVNIEKLYRKDMHVKVDGVKMDGGIYVLQKMPSYKIKAYLYKKASIFKISTCHREWVWENPGDEVEFTYVPLEGLEDTGYCPLELGAFDVKAQHSWAFFDFVDDESLPATVACNGRVITFPGVSACQCKKGVIQSITFSDPVEVFHHKRCNPPATEDKMTHHITLNQGKCIYLFQDDDGKLHRFTSLGYDDVMIRE